MSDAPDLIAAIDQQAATWRTIASAFGVYYRALIEAGLPPSDASRITIDLADRYHDLLVNNS